jgi:hypothetical protein
MSGPLLVAFTDRAGAVWLPPDGVSFRVERHSKNRFTAYKSATITASGPRQAVFELLETLRYGVTIYAATDPQVWLGFVETVNVAYENGALTGISLRDMANRVAVAYSYVEPGTSTVGVRKTTAWADDLASQAEFGVKEALISSDGTTNAGAAALRDTYLAEHALPVATTSYNGMATGAVTAQITCAGWLSTLGWKTYANAGTTDTATSAQLAAILGAGEFVTSVTVETASGISSSQYRKGDQTALEELLALCEAGTTAGRAYQCEIDEARNVRVVEAPASTEIAYRRRADGRVLSLSDELIDGYRIPAGRWVEHKDIIPASVDTTWLKNVGRYLVGEVEWLSSRPDVPVLTPAGSRGGVVGLAGGTGSGLSIPKVQGVIRSATPAMALAEYQALPELRGLWPMSSVNEGGHILDLSGQGRTLTNNGGAGRSVTPAGAPFVSLNGTSQYLSRADEAGLDITGNLSLGAWIYLTALPAVAGCVVGKITGAGNAYRLQVVNVGGVGYLDFIVTGATEVSARSAVPVPVGQWVLVGGLFSPSAYVISRVNTSAAVNVTAIPASLNNVAAPFTVGAMGFPDYYLPGYVSLPVVCAAQIPTERWNGLYEAGRHLFGV